MNEQELFSALFLLGYHKEKSKISANNFETIYWESTDNYVAVDGNHIYLGTFNFRKKHKLKNGEPFLVKSPSTDYQPIIDSVIELSNLRNEE